MAAAPVRRTWRPGDPPVKLDYYPTIMSRYVEQKIPHMRNAYNNRNINAFVKAHGLWERMWIEENNHLQHEGESLAAYERARDLLYEMETYARERPPNWQKIGAALLEVETIFGLGRGYAGQEYARAAADVGRLRGMSKASRDTSGIEEIMERGLKKPVPADVANLVHQSITGSKMPGSQAASLSSAAAKAGIVLRPGGQEGPALGGRRRKTRKTKKRGTRRRRVF